MLKVGKKRKIKQEIMHQILSQEDETNIQNYMILTQQNNTGADIIVIMHMHPHAVTRATITILI